MFLRSKNDQLKSSNVRKTADKPICFAVSRLLKNVGCRLLPLLKSLFASISCAFNDKNACHGWVWARGVLERGAILDIKLERGAMKTKMGLEGGAILELARARSAGIGGWSLESQGQRGSERIFPLPPIRF